MIVETRRIAADLPARSIRPSAPPARHTVTSPPAAAAPHGSTAPAYYDKSILKPPVWKWEIATYFFCGGLSAGAHVLSRLAGRFGGQRQRRLARAAAFVAGTAVLPCAPLLIADLGDPRRFHHMLRIFKPHSPMSLGSWTLTAYSGAVALNVLHEWRRQQPHAANTADGFLAPVALLIADAAGIPLALLMMSYTGVLLSCTATPLWTQNPWLGPLFSAGSIANAASALGLVLDSADVLGGKTAQAKQADQEAINRVDIVAHAVEGVALAGYLRRAGEFARPLTHGKMAPIFWSSVAGLALAEVIKQTASPRARWPRMLASAIGLAGGYGLRWALVYGGHESANDPNATRATSRPPAHHRNGAQTGCNC